MAHKPREPKDRKAVAQAIVYWLHVYQETDDQTARDEADTVLEGVLVDEGVMEASEAAVFKAGERCVLVRDEQGDVLACVFADGGTTPF